MPRKAKVTVTKFSSKHISIVLIVVLLFGGSAFLISPLSPFAKESTLTCANRDGLTAEWFKELTNTLNEIEDKADTLSKYKWQKPGQGVAFLRVMYVINTQIAEFEPQIAPVVLMLSKAQPCKNNDEYTRITKKMWWSLLDLEINLKTASEYDQFEFVFWSENAAAILPHISKFEGAYKEFLQTFQPE